LPTLVLIVFIFNYLKSNVNKSKSVKTPQRRPLDKKAGMKTIKKFYSASRPMPPHLVPSPCAAWFYLSIKEVINTNAKIKGR
jgi:hypothetical protein